MERDVRATYGASLSPDATAFAHLVDDGGYPRAVQRFLHGGRASSSRDVELPVEGPVTRVVHSADGHWLACQVAPEAGTRTQIRVVTTYPDDRMARRVDGMDAGTAELVAWDRDRVCAILTAEDGIGQSTLIDPADGAVTVLDRRSGGRLVDAWAGAALVRVGPRGYRELIMLRGATEIALLPSDPGSSTETGVILDDHTPRRLRCGPDGKHTELHQPGEYVRALVRSDNGARHARLLEVTVVADRDLLDALSPLQRVQSLTAPLLVVHGATDTNVPDGESEQIVEALGALGRPVRYLLFDDDGHEITRRESHAVLASTVADWVGAAFGSDV